MKTRDDKKKKKEEKYGFEVLIKLVCVWRRISFSYLVSLSKMAARCEGKQRWMFVTVRKKGFHYLNEKATKGWRERKIHKLFPFSSGASIKFYVFVLCPYLCCKFARVGDVFCWPDTKLFVTFFCDAGLLAENIEELWSIDWLKWEAAWSTKAQMFIKGSLLILRG